MNEKDFNEMIENIPASNMSNSDHKNKLRMALLNSRRTAGFSIILIILPLFFAIANILYYEMDIEVEWLMTFSNWLSSLDNIPVLNWLIRFLLLGSPLVVILLNLISITHFSYEKNQNELVFSFKLKWLNIGLITLCMILLSVFAAVLVIENINHP